jgi:hypothetical protein
MDWLKQEFEKEMDLIREENPDLPLYKQLRLAGRQVQAKTARLLGRIQSQRWSGYQDAVNKAFYG